MQHRQPSNIREEKHSWDRIPVWDGDKRQCKRYLRDFELYLETEKLDVDFSHGARLLSHLTGSVKKYAETIELDQIRRSTGAAKDTRDGITAGVKHLLRSLERAMGSGRCHEEGASPGVLLQETPETRRSTRARMGQCLRESGARHEGRRAECRAQEHELACLREEQFDPGATERVLGAPEGGYDFSAIRGALIKLSLTR